MIKKFLVLGILLLFVASTVESSYFKDSIIIDSDEESYTKTKDGIDEENKDCNCHNFNKENTIKTKNLFTKIKIKQKLSKYKHNPILKEKYQEIFNIINTNNLRDLFCNVLMRIGILIEKLGELVPKYRFIYSMLELIMIPIVILWNMYCD